MNRRAMAVAWRSFLLTGVLAISACGGGSRSVATARPGPYDLLSEPVREELFAIRYLVNDGRLELARERLAVVATEQPRNLRVATFLQDVELELIATGGAARGVRAEPGDEPGAFVERLYEVYRRRADEVPTSEAHVLAARLAPDDETTRALLDIALELDDENPWAHYGTAWAAAASGRPQDALASVESALAIDAGHLPSLRLEATLLGEIGEAEDSDERLRLWFDRALGDPTIDPARFAEARVDIALARVADGDPREALQWLEELEGASRPTLARAELVRAAALTARGQEREAVEAARKAQAVAPDELLAFVQQAQLLERFDNSASDQRKLWERVLEVIAARREAAAEEDADESSPVDFQSLLIQLQALTRLERLGETDGDGA